MRSDVYEYLKDSKGEGTWRTESPKVVGWMCPVCGTVNNPKSEECVKKCKGIVKNGNSKEANLIE